MENSIFNEVSDEDSSDDRNTNAAKNYMLPPSRLKPSTQNKIGIGEEFQA